MKEVKSIKFNFIMNLIRVLMTIVFPLITYPYATRVLNSAGVGRAAYVASIVSYFQLVASFGVNNYLQVRCSCRSLMVMKCCC